tara:strand:- start:642 stop:1139 length:498 start_codon:yes stop_codon:yes gene_type:complete
MSEIAPLMTHIYENKILEQKEQEEQKEDVDPLEDMSIEEIELKLMKEKATRCKVIALESLGHHPLANPTRMGRRDKKKVLDVMTLWFSKTNDEIESEFNDIIDDKLLGAGTDYTKYAIENNNIRHAKLPEDMEVCIPGGDIISVEGLNEEIEKLNIDSNTKEKVL